MKKWIMFILEADNKLDGIFLLLQNRAERLALDLIRPPLAVCDDIFAVNDLLARLVNLRVLNNSFLGALCKQELSALAALKKKGRFAQLYRTALKDDQITPLTERTRLQSSALRKCANILFKLGFSSQKLQADYGRLAAELKAFKVAF